MKPRRLRCNLQEIAFVAGSSTVRVGGGLFAVTLSGVPLTSHPRRDIEAWALSTLPRAMAYACSLLHDRSTAEDVVHDCYVRLLKKAETYNLPWDGTKLLFQSITNACIDKNHRERRLLSIDAWGAGESEEGSESLVSPGSNPIDLAVRGELEEALAESLQALSLSQRAAIELKGGSVILSKKSPKQSEPPQAMRGYSFTVPARRWRRNSRDSWSSRLMTRPESPSDRFLEDLVRRRLEKESERIDPRPLFERIQSSMEAEANGARIVNRITHTNARPVVWLWTGRIAAAVFLGVGLAILLQNRHVKTRGDVLVREARQAHSLPVDRCYVVEMRRDSALYDECAPMTSQVRLTRLWTRGDRFWVESAHSEHRRAWGRDHEGRFWIAFGPHRAIQLEADETSRWLNLCCDLYGVRLDQVLGDVLGNFDLKREETPSDSGRLATLNVQATLKPGRRTANIRSVQLEIDAETRIVRKMVIERVQKGQAFATVTYTLVETGTQRDDTYRLEGHLSNPHEIYTREHEPAKRKDLLIRWFGPESSNVFGQRQPFVDYLPPYKNPFAATTGFSKGSVKMISLRARLGLVAGLALCTVGFVSALGQQRPVIDAERAFAAGDADLDGKLSFEEYREQIRNGPMQKKAALKPALKANPAMAENLFRRCDADSDGYLTLAEYRKLFALRAGGMLAKNVAGKKASGSQPAPTVAASKETPVTPQESKFFKTKIRPVLVNQCAKCHAAGAEKIRGGLLVDSREGLRRGGDTGPAVVPGKPDESLLIQAIRYHDEDLKMPPKVKLPDAMIADFEA